MAKIKLHDVRKRCPDGELYIFKKGVAQVPGMRPPMFVTLAEFNQLSKEVSMHTFLQQLKEADGTLVIWPVQRKDNLLFRHCTGGEMVAVVNDFEKDFWPILKAHGFISYTIKDVT